MHGESLRAMSGRYWPREDLSTRLLSTSNLRRVFAPSIFSFHC